MASIPSDGPRPAIFLAAIFANSIDLESVAGGGVAVSTAYFLLQLIHFVGEKFHGTAALGADHMMMAAPIVLMLVAGDAVVERDLAGESAFGKQFESAIDGGVANAGILLLHQSMQFVSGKVVAGFEEGTKDRVALRSLLQTNLFEVTMQNRLSLAHHFAGDGRLIIDALLQHER